MAYSSAIDFVALLRQTPGGLRTVRMPGLDYIVDALARAGMLSLIIGQTAPTTNQATTAWFQPAVPSTVAEGTLFLWNRNTLEYEVATPVLWANLLISGASEVVQDVTVAGPTTVRTDATVVRVQNVGAPVALVMPLSSTKGPGVLISDWNNRAGANNITITLSGADVLPNGALSWTIAGDSGSVFMRPVPGGYAV